MGTQAKCVPGETKPTVNKTVNKVLIINCYDSRNKGDAAIVLGTMTALRKADPMVCIGLVTLAPEIDGPFYEKYGAEAIAAPTVGMKRPKILSFWLIVIAVIIGSLLIRVLGQLPSHPIRAVRTFLQALLDADVVISCGGGYWQDSWGYAVLVHLVQLVGAILSGKPVMALGISVGPFKRAFYRWTVAYWLNKYRVIVVRETISLKMLENLRVFKPETTLGTDMAFALLLSESENDGHKRTPPQPKHISRPSATHIGVTVRQWAFPGHHDRQQMQKNYEQALACALDRLIEELNAHVYFLPQVIAEPHDDDRKVARRVLSLMKESDRTVVIEDDLPIHDLIFLISSMDLVIATRFHSAILSFLGGVPVVAIEYEHKTSGIMKQMGLDEWVLHIDNVTSDDIVACCIAIRQKKDALREHILKKVNELSNIATENAKVVESLTRRW